MAGKRDIDKWVKNAASLPIKSFYPTAIVKALGLPLPLVFERLLFLVNDDVLELNWEISCPSCFSPVLKQSSTKVDCEEIYCHICDKDVPVDEHCVAPVFSFVLEYREDVKEETSKKKQKNLFPIFANC